MSEPQREPVAHISTEDPSAGTLSARRLLSAVWPYALVLLVGGLVLLPKLGQFGFWDPWEPKYAESAREMLERDSYVVPYYRDTVRLTKPILVYWGILAGSAVFGLNEFGARIVGIGFAIASMLGVYYAISLLRGRRAGLLSALVLGTLPQFFFISRQAMPDVYLFTSLGTGLVFLALGLFGPDKRRDLHFVISYVGFALAILAKGPIIVGAIVPTTLGVYLVSRIDLEQFWQRPLRKETIRLVSICLPASCLMGILSFVAFLFVASPAWWGYSDQQREGMAILQRRIETGFSRFHWAEIILVLIGACVLSHAALLVKRRAPHGKLIGAGLGLVALLAGMGLFAATTLKISISSVLGAATCIGLIGWSVWRFVRLPELWSQVQPYVRPVGRQLLLLAAVLLVVAGPWHVAIVLAQGHGYFTDFIIKHNVQRLGEVINKQGVSEFYLRVLIFGFFPWSCLIPVAVASLVGWWERNPLRRYGPEAFMLIASVVIYAAFSSSPTKFAHYLSPMIIPVAVLIGLALNRAFESRHATASRLTFVVAAALFPLPAMDLMRDAGSGSRYLVGSFTMKRFVPDDFTPGSYYEVLLIAFGILLLVSILVRSRLLLGGLVLSAVLMASYTTSSFIPALSTHKTMKGLCESWKQHALSGEPIGFRGDLKHGIYFYTENQIVRLRSAKRFHRFMDPESRKFCIVENKRLSALEASFSQKYPGHELHVVDDSHRKYHLISNFPLAE